MIFANRSRFTASGSPLRRIVATWITMVVASIFAADDGFVPLFNGKDLEGWDGAPGFWRVEGGAIVGETTPEKRLTYHSYLIWRGGEVADFHLKLEFKSGRPSNSGVQYRSHDLGGFVVRGYQCNLEASRPGKTGILEEMKTGRGGALAEAGQKVRFKPDGEREVLGTIATLEAVEHAIRRDGWNELEIVAAGPRLVHRINGVDIIDVVDEHPELSARSGILALQIHTGRPMRIDFRNIRLKQTRSAPP